MELTADIHRAFSEGGAKSVVARGLKKIARPAFRFGTLIFTECDLSRLPAARTAAGIIAREATIEDSELFEDRDLFLKRFTAGDRCFIGIEEKSGRLTNYRWVNTCAAYIPEIDRYLILKPGEAYAYDLNTLPEFRRRGIDAHTRHYTYSYLRDSGFTKLYAYIHGDNNANLSASRGFLREIGRIRWLWARGCKPIMIGGRGSNFPELRRC